MSENNVQSEIFTTFFTLKSVRSVNSDKILKFAKKFLVSFILGFMEPTLGYTLFCIRKVKP